VLEHLFKLGFSITDESAHWNSTSSSPMHVAAGDGRVDLLEIMISRGDGLAVINSFAHPCDWTPLMAAVNANHPHVVRYLIDAGADVNADDPTKIITSAVQHAVEDQRSELVAMLLAAGANPDVPGWMWISARDKAQESTPEIRAMIDAVPFKAVDHPRYVRDGQWPPPDEVDHTDDE
jgi:ankyrin repeat protein